MQNQNKKIMDIDERPKGRKGIEEMLKNMEEINDSSNNDLNFVKNKETA